MAGPQARAHAPSEEALAKDRDMIPMDMTLINKEALQAPGINREIRSFLISDPYEA